jgi:hypothetical protein
MFPGIDNPGKNSLASVPLEHYVSPLSIITKPWPLQAGCVLPEKQFFFAPAGSRTCARADGDHSANQCATAAELYLLYSNIAHIISIKSNCISLSLGIVDLVVTSASF